MKSQNKNASNTFVRKHPIDIAAKSVDGLGARAETFKINKNKRNIIIKKKV